MAQALIKKADAAGCPVLMVTTDRVAGRNQETLFRLMKIDTRECSGCHDRSSFAARSARRHNYDGIDLSAVSRSGESSNLTWETIKRTRDAAANGKMPVFIDGGFRRGTDVVKALAMGAKAVGVGRPYLWGLGAFGEDGVARVLEIMRTETRAAMQQCGMRSISELGPALVRRAS